MRRHLDSALWDVIGHPKFAAEYPMSSDVMQMLVSWISASELDRQVCACHALRGYSSFESPAIEAFQDVRCLQSLMNIITSMSDVRLCTDALRVMRNILSPDANRHHLSKRPLWTTLVNLIPHYESGPQQYFGLCLLRILIKGPPAGDLLLLIRKSRFDTQPPTGLPRLLEHYRNTQQLEIRIEIGRIIVGLWRAVRYKATTLLEQRQSIQLANAILETGEDIVKPVWALVKESGNPSLITEGWLGLVFIASTPEGSGDVWRLFRQEEAFALLEATLKEDEEYVGGRSNAYVLVDTLVTSSVSCCNLSTCIS